VQAMKHEPALSASRDGDSMPAVISRREDTNVLKDALRVIASHMFRDRRVRYEVAATWKNIFSKPAAQRILPIMPKVVTGKAIFSILPVRCSLNKGSIR